MPTVQVDIAVASEIKQTTPYLPDPFSADFSSGFGLGTYTFDPVFSVEWTQSVAQNITHLDATGSMEWRSSVVRDAIAAAEIKQAMPYLPSPFSADFSSDFGLGIYTIDPVFSVEWRQGALSATRDIPIPLEWGATQMGAALTPLDYKASLPYLGNPFTGEFTNEVGEGPYTIDPVFAMEWRATNFSVNVVVSAEFRSPVTANVTGLSDFRASLLRDAVFSPEWLGSTAGLISNSVSSIEWRGVTLRDITAGTEAGSVVPGSAAAGSAEWMAIAAAIAPGLAEWKVGFAADRVISVESRASIIANSGAAPVEYLQAVRLDCASAIAPLIQGQWTILPPIEFVTSFTPVLSTVPIDWNAITPPTFTGTVATISVEWKTTARMDSVPAVDNAAMMLATTQVQHAILGASRADSSASVEVESSAASGAQVPAEFGHLTFVQTMTMTTGLEFGAAVTSAEALPIEHKKVRHDWGAKLQPDQWERDHEP